MQYSYTLLLCQNHYWLEHRRFSRGASRPPLVLNFQVLTQRSRLPIVRVLCFIVVHFWSNNTYLFLKAFFLFFSICPSRLKWLDWVIFIIIFYCIVMIIDYNLVITSSKLYLLDCQIYFLLLWPLTFNCSLYSHVLRGVITKEYKLNMQVN